MNGMLTPDQIADLAGISRICEELGADLVVIGATSLLILMGDLGRFTRDVDLTVALDFDEFECGWRPSDGHRHQSWSTAGSLRAGGATTPKTQGRPSGSS